MRGHGQGLRQGTLDAMSTLVQFVSRTLRFHPTARPDSSAVVAAASVSAARMPPRHTSFVTAVPSNGACNDVAHARSKPLNSDTRSVFLRTYDSSLPPAALSRSISLLPERGVMSSLRKSLLFSCWPAMEEVGTKKGRKKVRVRQEETGLMLRSKTGTVDEDQEVRQGEHQAGASWRPPRRIESKREK